MIRCKQDKVLDPGATLKLKNIYGQRDDKEGVKKELIVLWVNKDINIEL